MRARRGPSIQIKTPEQFAVMREAGLVVAHTLAAVAAAVRPGVTTAEHDALAEREIRAAGAIPSFLGYHGYPATICTSVNDEIVHGIPSPARSLNQGDIISVDCGAIVRGWHGDAAVTVGVGAISAEHAALLGACEDALWAGLAQARPGAPHRRGGPVRRGRGVPRARHRPRHAHGPAGAELRPARPRAAAAGRPGAGRRADGDARQPGDRAA